ncbi:MAG: hypothetical protein AOA65_2006 [Candidatus Bathyarchaeota archaeon BA1]|nr:MAG: hypothetical protein AOA65_2006 [Candidatus Bathyarchaeota archaeon BA1]
MTWLPFTKSILKEVGSRCAVDAVVGTITITCIMGDICTIGCP